MNNENKTSILIVDDSDIIRQLLKSFFSEYNFEVITSQNGLEGIQKAIEHKPCLIFLDLMMPNFDGIKMLQVIKVMDNLKVIPVIVISGNTNRTNVLSALEAGADRVISKPLQKEVIIKNINELLGNDFLKKTKQTTPVVVDDKEFMNELRKIFLDAFPQKKQKILEGIKAKSKETLSPVIHELKGTAGAIGYQALGVVCFDIEKALASQAVDWSFVNIKCQQIFGIADKIEYSKSIEA
jgi:DNA-binding response OmpR family regulator